MSLDATHDPGLRSWVSSANAADTDFPPQNLPFGRFRRAGSSEAWRIGVMITKDDHRDGRGPFAIELLSIEPLR